MNVLFITGVLDDTSTAEESVETVKNLAQNLTRVGFPMDAVYYPPAFAHLGLPFAFQAQTNATTCKILQKGCRFSVFSSYFKKKDAKEKSIVVFLHHADLNYLLFDLTAKQYPFLKPLDCVWVEVFDWFRGCSKLHNVHAAADNEISFLTI